MSEMISIQALTIYSFSNFQNPAFGPAQVRALTSTMVTKAIQVYRALIIRFDH
jgi:hypothetical protein